MTDAHQAYSGRRILAWALAAALALGLAAAFVPCSNAYAVEYGDEESAVDLTPLSAYSVGVSLMKASDTSAGSMAASCLGSPAKLEIGPDGTAYVTADLSPVEVGSLTGYASDIKIYDAASYDTSAEQTTATVLAYQTAGENSYQSQIRFAVPDSAKRAGGVYISMYVDAMGQRVDAFIAIKYSSAESTGSYNADLATAAKVIDVIAALDTTSLPQVVSANDDYNALTDEQKAYVPDVAKNTLDEAYAAVHIIAVPVPVIGLAYTGSEIAGVPEGDGYRLAGNTATDAGSYTATATLEDGFTWSDGSADAKTINWSIGAASIAGAKVTLSKASAVYDGKTQSGAVKSVVLDEKTLGSFTDFTVSAKSGKKPGTYTVTVTGKGNYSGTATAAYKITKAANTLAVKAKTATVKYSKVKKKAQTLSSAKVLAVSKAKGTVAYTKISGNGKIRIDKKTGEVTVKKGLKKNTYNIKVKVAAAGADCYKAASQTVTFKVKVK